MLKYVVLIGAGIGAFAAGEAAAKTPGSTYCFSGVCHRVATLAETQAQVGRSSVLATSYYDDCRVDRLNPCGLTSSGEAYRPDKADNAASPVLPDGTTLLLYNPTNRKAMVVRVNNAGPYHGSRKLDVSRATAERLGFKHRGTANLVVRVVKAPRKAEATYSRNRRYRPVAGYIGEYATADAAAKSFNVLTVVKALASSLLAPLLGGAILEATERPAVALASSAAAPKSRAKGASKASAKAVAKPAKARTAKLEPGKSTAKKAQSAAAQPREVPVAKSRAAIAGAGGPHLVRAEAGGKAVGP